jgi:CHAD domain-containing protein
LLMGRRFSTCGHPNPMARSAPSAHPLQTLTDNIKAFEAAILVCLSKPNKKAVHKLRTTTRRIEAQLELLGTLPNLPPHDKQAQRARRLLKKLRSAAGHVRDLDVQRALIADEAAGKNGGPRPTPEIRKEATRLRRKLKHERDKQAADLLQLLKKHRKKFPVVFEKLLDALEPAESLTLSQARLIAIVREWYAQHTPGSSTPPDDPDELHNIRKRAKLARYLAESAPESAASARRLAAHFESLQQAGGKWHDWLLLQKLSASKLGKSAKLPQRFSARADDSLRDFKRRLTKAAPQHSRAA